MQEDKSLIKPILIEEKKELVIRPKDMSLNNKKFIELTKMNIKSINHQVLELIKISQVDIDTL